MSGGDGLVEGGVRRGGEGGGRSQEVGVGGSVWVGVGGCGSRYASAGLMDFD